MPSRIVCLPGDGIGPEVMAVAVRVLEALPLDLAIEEHPFGGAAIDAVGDPLPAETLAACRAADVVLLGAVGGPKWDGGSVRPEAGLIGLRRELDVYANLRPAVGRGHRPADRARARRRPLLRRARRARRRHRLRHVEYHPTQVERLARRAFELARTRSGRLLSVDKANVLDTSRLWRRVVTEVARRLPRRRAAARPRRLGRDEHRHRPRQLRRDGDGEHLRRHPLRRRRRRDRRARPGRVGEPRRRRPGHLRAGARLGARHRRHRPREPDRDAALARAGARARPRRGRRWRDASRRRSTAAARPTPTPDVGGTATTAEFGDAVLAELEGGAGMSTIVGYPGPAGSHSAARVAPARARGRDASSRYASFIARRRGGGRGGGVARRAADRELAPRPGRRDARPALRGAALDRLRGDAADRPLPAREGADPGLRGEDAALDTRSRSTSAATSCTRSACAASRRPRPPTRAREVAESDDPTEAAIASAEAAARFGLHVIATGRRRPRGVHALRRRSRRTRASTAAPAGARRSRSSPTTSRARSTTRSARSTGTA